MNDDYSGNERRKNNNEIALIVGKLENFMKNSEHNQKMMIKNVDDKLSGIDEKLSLQVDRLSHDITQLEEKGTLVISNHSADNKKDHETLTEYMKRISSTLDTRIDRVDERVDFVEKKLDKHIDKYTITNNEMNKKIDEINEKPIKVKAKMVDNLVNIFMKIIFTALASGTVGFLVWAVLQYLSTLPI